MQAKGVRPNVVTYNAAMRACGTAALWPVALSLFEDLRDDGIVPTVITYNAALAACERGAQWQEALLLLDEMQQSTTRAPRPDRISFHTAIGACRRAGTHASARAGLALLRRMRAVGILPSVIALTGVMSACVSAGRWRAALAVFEHMRGVGVAADSVACARETLTRTVALESRRAIARPCLPDPSLSVDGLSTQLPTSG